MITMNRGRLKRLVEQGRIEAVGSYHFDDQHGGSRSAAVMPVAMDPDDWHDRKEGTVYLRPDHFTSKSGRAYDAGNGLIMLIVHSNLNYTLRVREPAERIRGREARHQATAWA